MRNVLRDYELKRGRAMHHFYVLRESVEGAINTERELVPGEFDPNAGKYRFQVPLERIDPGWVLRLGEFVYNTRASLDYLITALIRSTGNEENEFSEFPIYGIERISWQDIDQWWEKDPKGRIRRKLRGTPAGTKATLKPLQPFYRVPRTNPVQHPLFALEVLSNRDKHRRLNLLVHRASLAFVDARRQPIFEGPPAQHRIAERDEGDTYTVTLAVSEERDMGVYLLPAYEVRLDEPPELVGNLIETLGHINQFIDSRILPAVRALL